MRKFAVCTSGNSTVSLPDHIARVAIVPLGSQVVLRVRAVMCLQLPSKVWIANGQNTVPGFCVPCP